MTRLVTTLLALLLLGAWLPLSTAAGEEVPAGPPAEEVVEEPGEPEEPLLERLDEGLVESLEEIEEALEEPLSVADATHGRISEGVLATAGWIDSFFSDQRVESELGETRVRLRFSIFAEEESTTEYDVQANVRLDLPLFEGKLQLLLAGDPEEDDDFQALTGREGAPPQLAAADDRVSASLRYFLLQTLVQNISLRAGVRLRSGIPALFLEPRYRHLVALDSWLFRFTQRFVGFTDGTVGARTTLDLEEELRPPLFFRTSADGSWFSDREGYAYSLGFFLFQPLSPRSVLLYSWANSFRTRPNDRLEEIVLSARLRQQVWREWFYYELAPQLSFPHERNYQMTPGFLVRLEVTFGDYPRLSPKKAEAGEG